MCLSVEVFSGGNPDLVLGLPHDGTSDEAVLSAARQLVDEDGFDEVFFTRAGVVKSATAICGRIT